ncbi:MAG: penicillin-binding protein activator [Congregibacter sp.]
MLIDSGRWRIVATLVVIPLFVVACGSSPDSPPNRAEYPGSFPGGINPEAPPVENDTQAEELDASEFLPDVDAELFEATRIALAAGDWLAATLALPKASVELLPERIVEEESISTVASELTATALWTRYYDARIKLLKGDVDVHDALIDSLTRTALPGTLHKELLLHKLGLAALAADAQAQVWNSYRLLRAGGHSMLDEAASQAALWRAAQLLSPDQSTNLSSRGDPDLQAWLTLASASNEDSAQNAATAITVWRERHPEHAATAYADSLLEAALRDAQTTQITLLLPLSGSLEKAGDAVSRGFLAAYYADQQNTLSIDIVDSRRHDSVSAAYVEASQRGADIVIGPLGKQQVAELLAQTTLPTPLLALNRPETQQMASASALLLSLAPEDEARQLAERAYADGMRRALLVRPEGVWGDRMQRALDQRWRELGGKVPSQALYGNPSTHSDSIRNALGLDRSASRSAAVRGLFDARVETSGRRREDLDAVFLLSKNTDEARALKPMINYHYAGDLTVYALSTADSGSDDPAQNRDLGDVRLLAMPWRLTDDGLTSLIGNDDSGSYAALNALGADAFAVARRWWRMSSAANPVYEGYTAELHAAEGNRGTLLRRLKTAEFDRGVLTPR